MLSDQELALEIIDSVGDLAEAVGPNALARYFDCDAFARDMQMNREISVVEAAGGRYVFVNPLDF